MIKILLLLLVSNSCFSQESVKVKYHEYIFSDYPLIRNDELFIDLKNQKNIFLMDINTQKDLDVEKKYTDEDFEEPDVYMSISREFNDYVYIDFKNNKTVLYEDWTKKFFKINDSFPVIKWQLLEETKLVNNIICKKAMGTYRGNTWQVWYAPSIALPYGPWKLNGLPGLILEAIDQRQKYHYIAYEILYSNVEEIKIPENKVIKELGMKEYLLFIDDFYNTPKDYGRDIKDTSPKFNFLEREFEFEFDIKFKWEE